MSTIEDAAPVAPRAGHAAMAPEPSGNENRGMAKVLLAVLAGVLAALAVLVVIALAGVFFLRSSSSENVGPQEVAVAADAPAGVAPETLLVDFARAWSSGDWDVMSAFASADVIATAQEFQDGGGTLDITDANVDEVMQRCVPAPDGGTSCEVYFAPSTGFGLIFTATYATVGDALLISNLEFGGDMG